MILVDTSVWIEFFKSNPVFTNAVELLLESKQIAAIEPVFSELLYGCRNDKERNIVKSYWKVLPRIKFGEGSYLEAAEFANKNDYHRLGIGLTDAILVKATIDNRYLIWTLDKIIMSQVDPKFLYQP